MPRTSKYDAQRLRDLINSGKNANEICTELGITKPTLKNYLFKLIQDDKEFYEIPGLGSRMTQPKVTKNGLKFSLQKMEELGFSPGDKIRIQKQDDGKFFVEKSD